MAKVLPKIGPYDVIPDTNALFAQDPRKLVSGGFESALLELRKITQVNLYIPHTVLGELAYRKYSTAANSHESATQNWNTIANITGLRPPRAVSNAVLKTKIIRRYQAWLKSVKGKQLKPRMAQRTWEKLLHDAIWRNAPFEHSDDTKHEKGFRDRVIFESVAQFRARTGNEIVFLCNDGRLREAVTRSGFSQLVVLPRLEDFASRVRLMKDNAEKAWVDELFSAASTEFYREGNAECFYYRAKVYESILTRTEDLTPPGQSLSHLLNPATWERKTDERITLGTTQFERYSDGRALWVTEVKSAAAFAGKNIIDLLNEEIRVSTFTVRWSSLVTENAEVSDPRLEAIEFKERVMFSDTREERMKWSLPEKPSEINLNWAEYLKAKVPASNTGQPVGDAKPG